VVTQRTARYQQIVDRFDAVARANLEMLVRIADICHTAGVSQDTLRRAFREVRGTTPSRYLREFQLAEARRALLSGKGSVTEIAMLYGFRELGRFAVNYRVRFGESPSETLRRASAGSP
jgi:transcriptional regulator GlxA family with amidase domain